MKRFYYLNKVINLFNIYLPRFYVMVRLKRNMGENFLLEVKKTKFKILKIGEDIERKLGDMVQRRISFNFR